MPFEDPPLTSSDQKSSGFRSAFFDARAHIRLWGVAAVGLLVDLWSKDWAFETLQPSDVRVVIPKVLTFRRSINPGALFGMGPGLVSVFIVASFVALGFVLYMFICSDRRRRSLHLALSFVLAGSMGNLYDRAFIMADKVTLKSTLPNGGGSRYGKIVSNEADSEYIRLGQGPDGAGPVQRIARKDIEEIAQVGVVRDFLKIEPRIAGYDIWPWVFNVADSLLVLGVGILIINLWIDRKEHRHQVAEAAVAGGQT